MLAASFIKQRTLAGGNNFLKVLFFFLELWFKGNWLEKIVCLGNS